MGWAEVFPRILGEGVDVEFRAYDGSRAGRPGADVAVEIRSPLALSHLAASPDELGLARAYITGALEVHGDMYETLARFPAIALDEVPMRTKLELFGRLAASRFWWPVRPPAEEHRARGRRHSKSRDSSSVSHHYDVSNRFYEWVLGPSMAYTCACYPTEDATLEQAQFTKHDLVARKLGLQPGMRLLDVGCGWGGMVMHAAEHYGVRALGVTLSRQQAQWAQKAIVDRGLADLAEVRYLDYRDVPETGFDAISSIGMTEHIGLDELPGYFTAMHDKLRPGGRLYLAEFHPLTGVLDDERGATAARDYFARGAQTYDSPGSYADRTAETEHNTATEWHRTLGDVLSAVAAAGLRIEFVHEHDVIPFQRYGALVADGARFRYPAGSARLPLMYSLAASAA